MSGADSDAVLASPGGRGLLPEVGARAGPVGPVDMLATRANSAFGKPPRRAWEQNTRKVAAAANETLAAASGAAPGAPAAAAIAHELVHHARSTTRRAHEQYEQSGALKRHAASAKWCNTMELQHLRSKRSSYAGTASARIGVRGSEGTYQPSNRQRSRFCSSSGGGEACAGTVHALAEARAVQHAMRAARRVAPNCEILPGAVGFMARRSTTASSADADATGSGGGACSARSRWLSGHEAVPLS